MNQLRYAFIAFGALALVAIYGWPYLFEPSIDSLVNTALNASSPSDQLAATRKLCQKGAPALEGLRRVTAESNNEDVVAACLSGVSLLMDYESMDQILNRLDDSSLVVRSAAAKAATKLLGRDHHFPVRGLPEEQQRVKNEIVKDWESYNGSKLFEFNKKRIENSFESEGSHE